MAVLSKADLRAAIDTVFASAKNITAKAARGEYHDWIDSLLAPASIVPGAGITASTDADGAVTIAAGGAAAAVGIPSFVPSGAAQPSAAVLTASIAGLAASPPFPSLVYLLTPNDLDRAADDLELRINGDVSRVRPVVDFRGDPLAARDLDQGALYEVLATFGPAQQYRMTEPVLPRLQDFDIVASWLPQPPYDQAAFEAYVSDPDNHATSDTSSITQVAPTDYAARTVDFVQRVIGLPLDAPDVAVIQQSRGGQVGFTHIGPWDGREFMGSPMKWFNMGPVDVADLFPAYTITYEIEFAPYA